MKNPKSFKLLCLVFLALLSLPLSAREYKPMLKSGRVWKCFLKGDSWDGVDRYLTVSVCGDTIAQNRECKRVHFQYYTTEMENFNDYYTAAYEENGKLYTTVGSDEGFALLLDFSLNKGDVAGRPYIDIDEDWTPNVFIDAVDTIEVRGKVYRRLKLTDSYFGNPVYWVEGIGANYEGWYTYFPVHNADCTYMLECYDDGELVFTKDDFYTEPVPSGIGSVKDGQHKSAVTYDLAGRRIAVPKQGGVYIKDGEKRVCR